MKISVLVFGLLMAISIPSLAAEHRSGEKVVINNGETISEDLFVASRDIQISGRVEGDIYAIGEHLVINGDVAEDVLATCRTLGLSGDIADSVLFTGQELILDGHIGGDVMALGAEVRITPQTVIDGDLLVAAGQLTMEGGLIKGNIKGHVGDTMLNGTVNQDIDLKGGSVTFGDNYQGQGAVRLTLDTPMDPDQAGLVPNNLEVKIKEPKRSFPFFGLFNIIWSMVAAFIVGLVLVIFFKPTIREYLDFARTTPIPKTGLGFVYLVVVPVAILILFLMIFTIPVALIASVLYLIALYVGNILAGLAIGEWIVKRFRKNHPAPSLILSLIVGIVLIKIATHIPILGWLIALAVVCYGLGSIVNFLWQYRKTSEAGAEF